MHKLFADLLAVLKRTGYTLMHFIPKQNKLNTRTHNVAYIIYTNKHKSIIVYSLCTI